MRGTTQAPGDRRLGSSFGDRLRHLRELRGLGQRGLGHASGVAASTLNMLEKGDRHPSRRLVLDIARALELTPFETDELLVAALHLPEAFASDPDVSLAVKCLTDPSVSEDKRQQFREVVRLTAKLFGYVSGASPVS